MNERLLEWVVGIDWRSLVFVLVLAIFLRWLRKLDQDPDNGFKLHQFVADKDGRADKYGLAYCLVLLVGSWSIWYEAGNGRLTEWLVVSVIGAFVVGAAVKTSVSAVERVRTADNAVESKPAEAKP